MNQNMRQRLVYVILIIFLGLAVYSFFIPIEKKADEVAVSQIAGQVSNGEVDRIVFDQESKKATAYLKNGTKEEAYIELDAKLSDYGITSDKVKIEVQEYSNTKGMLLSLASIFVPVILIMAFFWFMMRRAQSGNDQAMLFGRSKPRLATPSSQKITFKDVAGVEEAKQELVEVVEFLKYPKKFQSLGAEIPKGVLLMGPPGTGKTLLAKAVAGEAGVPFFSISASEFMEMFVGVGASRVRDLFYKAKKNAPCIVFIDELDAIGRQRGTGLGGSHDEREQTLNQILVEMDGFDTDTNVIILAATNRPDVLDPALLRPGRFDRQVVLDMPDIKAREGILEVHIKGKPLTEDIDIKRLAKITSGFSGADIKNLVNEAAILAARRNKKKIAMTDMTESVEKVILGPERKSRIFSEKEKNITAHHEAGHALVAQILPDCDKVHKVSIISRGMAAGYTWSMPDEDRRFYTKSRFLAEIAQLLAGRAAEELIFGEISTGAENDLRRATRLARSMVTDYGMSEHLGPRTFGEREEVVFLGRELGEHRNYSEDVAAKIDVEVDNFVKESYKKAQKILTDHRAMLEKIAGKLLKEETIEGVEFDNLFKEKPVRANPSKETPQSTSSKEESQE